MIRQAKISDASQIADIYNYYVLNTIITFEMLPISTAAMSEKIVNTMENYPWIVFEKNGEILGYAYVTEWKSRGAYKNSVESTVYLKPNQSGKGSGSALYVELISQLKKLNIHSIIGGIGQPNEASIALHEKLGFKKVAHFKEIGFKFDKWVDVAYWQLII
ncbi:MAG: L-amino acid N-acyltransferase YncA [Saprospiraceae bacterium]|jgi:L-amino acid N-acyltransferase YncA